MFDHDDNNIANKLPIRINLNQVSNYYFDKFEFQQLNFTNFYYVMN